MGWSSGFRAIDDLPCAHWDETEFRIFWRNGIETKTNKLLEEKSTERIHTCEPSYGSDLVSHMGYRKPVNGWMLPIGASWSMVFRKCGALLLYYEQSISIVFKDNQFKIVCNLNSNVTDQFRPSNCISKDHEKIAKIIAAVDLIAHWFTFVHRMISVSSQFPVDSVFFFFVTTGPPEDELNL